MMSLNAPPNAQARKDARHSICTSSVTPALYQALSVLNPRHCSTLNALCGEDLFRLITPSMTVNIGRSFML